jgi:outer membrane scaffolding protein for murein synthesis (MipA/OmpV family)
MPLNAHRAFLLLGLLLISARSEAASILDYIRNYDLNDYAVGIAVSGSQNPYAGAASSAFAYPYLTSFRDPSFTDDWLFIADSSLGVRWVTQNDWELGVLGRIQTLGFTSGESEQLLGVANRKWTLEMGPAVGWRGWPVHINLATYTEVSNRHGGWTGELRFSYPMEWSRGYFVPHVDLIYQDSDYTNYYYGVTVPEALPGRLNYTPGAATSTALNARWGYALSDHWLLSGALGVEYLGSAIKDSPIVNRNHIWSAHIGLAYNANVFQPREYDHSAPDTPRFEMKVSAFRDMIGTEIVRETSNGVPGAAIGVEEIFGVPEKEVLPQLDMTLRIGNYHRIELGYFALGRESSNTLANDLVFGDVTFPAGTTVDVSMDTRILRAGYSYSLLRDAQKELGFMIGVHVANFDASVTAEEPGLEQRSNAGTPLPVVGAHGAINFGERMTLGGRVQVFRTDFDRYEGRLLYAMLELQYRATRSVGVGLSYSFYGMKLSSELDELNGYLSVRHYGPAAFVTVGF